ncbi:MAG: hypothetical protein H0Z32_11530 [Bacillaceae bacterium]|nr:hypothetical protein [Bacillaceae bacterium]
MKKILFILTLLFLGACSNETAQDSSLNTEEAQNGQTSEIHDDDEKNKDSILELKVEDFNTSTINFAMMMFREYLESLKQSASLSKKIKDYHINNIEVIEQRADGFKFSVNFDLKPFDWDQYIVAGNGVMDEESKWIKRKILFVDVEKEHLDDAVIYRIVSLGTGP